MKQWFYNMSTEILKMNHYKWPLNPNLKPGPPGPQRGRQRPPSIPPKEGSKSCNSAFIFSPPSEGPGEARSQGETKPGYMTANPAIYKRIKEVQEYQKKHPTKAEIIIWKYLRNKKTGYKIRRQHIIDRYIADFVCLRKKLIIEIDGKIHLKQREYDDFRTEILNELGLEVIRFSNDDIFRNPEAVVLQIKEKLDGISFSLPSEGPGEARSQE